MNNQVRKSPQTKMTLFDLIKLILSVALVIYSICHFLGLSSGNTKQSCIDAACKDVKSDIYYDYHEVVNPEGRVIYHTDDKYIVIVKYNIPNLNWKGSRACLVTRYRYSDPIVWHTTTEMSYNYNWNGQINELKALWKLD